MDMIHSMILRSCEKDNEILDVIVIITIRANRALAKQAPANANSLWQKATVHKLWRDHR